MVTVPIKEAVNSLKVVTRDTYEYVVAKTLGTYLN
jgi:hypothetical protein